MSLAAAAMIAVVGALIVVASVRSLVRLLDEQIVSRVPVAREQTIELDEPGDYVVHLEGPRLSRVAWLAGLASAGGSGPMLVLRDASLGADVPLRATLMPTRSGGLSRVRVSLARFHAGHRGRYTLDASEWDAGPASAAMELVVTRPYAGPMVARILAVVAGGLLVVGGLVWGILAAVVG